ncbi:hypothetical protein [Xylocopilactobacillus apis]|uniref:Uncharacterized protein n=1 Tax=Xylocopilactobacillus apis TaxID=2932183 RepID=A0AAU9DUB5_9LACO|nr:hypothetical protein [Xylocopilactobacillus apis]BDR57423.1 hypothetical protein KIMC2_19850 [Xylocopilactobacillus apis]
MISTIIVISLILVLLVLEFEQQKKIKIYARQKISRIIIAVVIGMALIILMWPKTFVQQVNVILVAFLLIGVSFFKEGLSVDRLITFSSIGSGSEYKRFSKVIIYKKPSKSGFINVRFEKGENSYIDFEFVTSFDEVYTFLSKHFKGSLKIV